MDDVFEPMKTAEAWQLSNAPVLAMAAHRAALDLFDQTSMEELRKKSVHLTAILENTLLEIGQKYQTGWRLRLQRIQRPVVVSCPFSFQAEAKRSLITSAEKG